MIDKDDTFLARWLNNELSEEERTSFEESPEYQSYQKILLGTAQLLAPSFDEEGWLTKLKNSNQKLPAKKSIHRQLWPYGIAAAVLLLIGIFFSQGPATTTITTAYGKQQSVLLPDGSEMILNAGANASFTEKSWGDNRIITLDGEALFKVAKGSTFTVQTKTGEVRVLGTIFNVKSEEGLLEVSCFEGKVSVNAESGQLLLTKGQAMRALPNQKVAQWVEKTTSPGWISQESNFKSLPVKYVLKALEKQYGLRFEKNNLDESVLFSGSFPHHDLEVALKSVFGSLQVEYTLNSDRKVILKDNSL